MHRAGRDPGCSPPGRGPLGSAGGHGRCRRASQVPGRGRAGSRSGRRRAPGSRRPRPAPLGLHRPSGGVPRGPRSLRGTGGRPGPPRRRRCRRNPRRGEGARGRRLDVPEPFLQQPHDALRRHRAASDREGRLSLRRDRRHRLRPRSRRLDPGDRLGLHTQDHERKERAPRAVRPREHLRPPAPDVGLRGEGAPGRRPDPGRGRPAPACQPPDLRPPGAAVGGPAREPGRPLHRGGAGVAPLSRRRTPSGRWTSIPSSR